MKNPFPTSLAIILSAIAICCVVIVFSVKPKVPVAHVRSNQYKKLNSSEFQLYYNSVINELTADTTIIEFSYNHSKIPNR